MATRCWNLLQKNVAITTTNPWLCTHLDVWACVDVCMWCYYSQVIWRVDSIQHRLEGSTRLKANILDNVGKVLAKELHSEQHKAGVNHAKLKL